MRLSEIFHSIQGEGPLQGRPALFIRLAGCNLTCTFCDTPYAQKPTDASDLDEVRAKMIEMTSRYGLDYPFVITGGEPLLQQDAVHQLLGMYFARSPRRAHVWFETNGTIVPARELVKKWRPNFVVSPKVGHVNNDALKALSELGAHFKFVVDEEEGWDFVVALKMAETFEVPRGRVWMQPMAKDKKTLDKAGRVLWDRCVGSGVGFSPRLHVVFFGTKRGV